MTRFLLLARFGLVWLMLAACAVAPSARGQTLQELFDGGSLVVGDSMFSQFELLAIETDLAPPDLAQMVVVPLTDMADKPGFQLVVNQQMESTGDHYRELRFQYRVSSLAGGNSFAGIDMRLDGFAASEPWGIVHIDQPVFDRTGRLLGGGVVSVDIDQELFVDTWSATFVPRRELVITAEIHVESQFGTVGFDSYSTYIHQTGPAGLLGDYNDDRVVDAADYTVWRNNRDTSNLLPNDATPGMVGSDDYLTWKAHFGLAAGEDSLRMVPIPEPTWGGMVCGVAVVAGRVLRRWRNSHRS